MPAAPFSARRAIDVVQSLELFCHSQPTRRTASIGRFILDKESVSEVVNELYVRLARDATACKLLAAALDIAEVQRIVHYFAAFHFKNIVYRDHVKYRIRFGATIDEGADFNSSKRRQGKLFCPRTYSRSLETDVGLQLVVASLPKQLSHVIQLRAAGMSLTQIATAVGLSARSVSRRLNEAKQIIKRSVQCN